MAQATVSTQTPGVALRPACGVHALPWLPTSCKELFPQPQKGGKSPHTPEFCEDP